MQLEDRRYMLMYGLLPPTATVVITYAHYGFKEVVVCLGTFQKMRMAQARLRLWSSSLEVRLAPSPQVE